MLTDRRCETPEVFQAPCCPALIPEKLPGLAEPGPAGGLRSEGDPRHRAVPSVPPFPCSPRSPAGSSGTSCSARGGPTARPPPGCGDFGLCGTGRRDSSVPPDLPFRLRGDCPGTRQCGQAFLAGRPDSAAPRTARIPVCGPCGTHGLPPGRAMLSMRLFLLLPWPKESLGKVLFPSGDFVPHHLP